MKLYNDQQVFVNEILEVLKLNNRCLGQLATGGGKTACFSFIAKNYTIQTGEKVLILAHREELINQTISTLRRIGASCESVLAHKKRLNHQSDCYVAMVQTLKKRLATDNNFLKNVGLIIIDECHLLMHEQIFEYYPNAKILGVTATPTLLKKISFSKCYRCGNISEKPIICHGVEMTEFTKDYTLSEIYENIVIGTSITDLIENNRLVPEIVFATSSVNRSEMKIGKDGDFTDNDEIFGNSNATFNVVLQYQKICNNKKTIIFNSSTKVNSLVYQQFLDAGYTNVKMFDSVNSKKSERKETIEWFTNNNNAILLNCGCFTTGFDEPTIENVILNLATKSLSKYLQMVGRGGRTCDKIYKPTFNLIDLGGNVDEHDKWSDEKDWKSIFFGTNKKPKPKKEVLDNTTQCKNCDTIYAKSDSICPECDAEMPIYIKKNNENLSNEVAQIIDEIPKPCGKKIVNYVLKIEKDKNFAWTVLINSIFDMFIYHNVNKGMFLKSVNNGNFEQSIRNLLMQPYQVIQNSELESGTLRTKNYLLNKIKSKLEKHYD